MGTVPFVSASVLLAAFPLLIPHCSLSLFIEMTSFWFEAMPAIWSPSKDCVEVTFAVVTPVVEDGFSPFSQSVGLSFSFNM